MSPQERFVTESLAHLFPKRETAELLAVEIIEGLRRLAQSEYVPSKHIQEVLGYSPSERERFLDSILEELGA